MTAVLTRDQADLLIRYGVSWRLADIIVDPDRGISESISSAYGAVTGTWMWTTDGKGVHAVRWSIPKWDPGDRTERSVELPWTAVRQAVRAIPPKLLYAVDQARREHRRQINHRVEPFCPGGRAPFVYPDLQWERDAKARLAKACAAAINATLVTADAVSGQLDLFEVA